MRLFSTEQVSKYHPDKMCDQISDAILDACLAQDPNSHVAIECMAKGTAVILAGEITTNAKVDYTGVVMRVAGKLGYRVSQVLTYIEEQSPEIARGVGKGEELGAGDQGMMFGFACNESDSFLPFGFDLANKIIAAVEHFTEDNRFTVLNGDAKTMVTVDLDAEPDLSSVHSILVSVCHKSKHDIEFIRKVVLNIVNNLLDEVEKKTNSKRRKDLEIIINPAGAWTLGGPAADCGLTGRKIVCDQYGGYCAVGGGAFSGKDPTKVDRSGAYMARKIAVDVLKEFDCDFAQVQIGYAIGRAEPLGVYVSTPFPDVNNKAEKFIAEKYDLTPAGIIKALDLRKPQYEHLAEGCHFREV